MSKKLFISMLLAISLVSCGGKYKVVIQKEGEEKKRKQQLQLKQQRQQHQQFKR